MLSEAVYIFAGAARAGKFWQVCVFHDVAKLLVCYLLSSINPCTDVVVVQEKQYMSIMDKDFNILRSWILFDPHPKRNSPTKPQKNWFVQYENAADCVDADISMILSCIR